MKRVRIKNAGKDNIIIIIDKDLKERFADKAQMFGGMSEVIREMIENYLSIGGFQTKREKKLKTYTLVKELGENGFK